jgi:hypothetical protein
MRRDRSGRVVADVAIETVEPGGAGDPESIPADPAGHEPYPLFFPLLPTIAVAFLLIVGADLKQESLASPQQRIRKNAIRLL